MKKLIFGTTFIASISAFAQVSQLNNPGNTITFSENKGQIHDQNYNPRPDVLYGVMAGDMAVHIKRNGVSYQLYQVNRWKEEADPVTLHKTKMIGEQTIYRVDLTWLNANRNISTFNEHQLSGYNNYYLPNCPDGVLYAKSYKAIKMKNIYNGITLHYYEKEGNLKHDYIIAPYADYKQIQIRVTGAEVVLNDDGTLLLATPFGKIQEGAPIVYQKGRKIGARWIVKNNILSFEIGDYNANEELVIDPETRLWGTYYGTSANDYGTHCSTDKSGNVFLGGYSSAPTTTLIATSGSHQINMNGGSDAFVAKFNGNGTRLWATYYGGSSHEISQGTATDKWGNVFLCGYTSSDTTNVIASAGSHQIVHGGWTDAFLVKFDGNGVRQWGTYYGGTANERAISCAADQSGNVYVAGYTEGSTGTVIAVVGSHQSNHAGANDAFLVKFSPNGNRLWGTYYGGTQHDYGSACAVDNTGDVYMVGNTATSTGTIIASGGSHQVNYGGGSSDGFIAKFDGGGTRLWGSYFGGTGSEGISDLCLDPANNIYIVGSTTSTNAISTSNSHQTVRNGNNDGFVSKLTSSSIRQWGTYYGGAGNDPAVSCATDHSGHLYVAGITLSAGGTLIATASGIQNTFGGGSQDSYLVKFNLAGTRLAATYCGGAGEDWVYGCSVDSVGNVFIAGRVEGNSGNAISSANGHQPTFGGSRDAFLVKYGCALPAKPSSISGPISLCADSGTVNFSVTAEPYANFDWQLPTGWTGTNSANTITVQALSAGILTVTAKSNCGMSPASTIDVTVHALPILTTNPAAPLICAGESITIDLSGAMSYSLDGNAAASPILLSPPVTSTYSLSGTNSAGCANSKTLTVTVDECASVIDRKLGAVRAYPNPAREAVIIESEHTVTIEITNIDGKMIVQADCFAGKTEIQIGSFAKGVYFLNVKGLKQDTRYKLVKM